ncbi:MoaD/ThiS family protein [Dyadobacter sandarakinus]|uniref:MoaD/ThiS family protein n=1 Tax=Dyadobacter sandarakinus TaxID=2747268 RepID=A0ABX7I8A0_9BACT|nr:MoaD/ThiS family protein [Dyadobacter sandarakinus]QRR02020.1 MoaD/ThiS family protein [Dyadobacter sandarakinus]
MSFRITYYGMLAEIAGRSEELLDEDGRLTVGQLRGLITDKYPAMRERKFKIAVNQQIADDLAPVEAHAEIALLPPFAGG